MEGYKASQHHSEHSVHGADICVHEARALVVAVLVSVFLGQQLEVEIIQSPPEDRKEGQIIRKKKHTMMGIC